MRSAAGASANLTRPGPDLERELELVAVVEGVGEAGILNGEPTLVALVALAPAVGAAAAGAARGISLVPSAREFADRSHDADMPMSPDQRLGKGKGVGAQWGPRRRKVIGTVGNSIRIIFLDFQQQVMAHIQVVLFIQQELILQEHLEIPVLIFKFK